MSKILIDRAVVESALSDVCAARLCEVNSMSSRQEMLRLMIRATDALRAALEQEEQATVKEFLQVGQEEPEGGWQFAPSPQVTQRIADMPMSEYRRGVNDGFKLGLREGRIEVEDEMREQEEQEPVAIKDDDGLTLKAGWDDLPVGTPLYTTPPRREWQGLTEEEIDAVWEDAQVFNTHYDIARAIEAALRSKNHD